MPGLRVVRGKPRKTGGEDDAAKELRRQRAAANRAKHEEAFAIQIRALKYPEPQREFRFGAHAAGVAGKGLRERLLNKRLSDWKFDFCWPELMLAFEVEGGGQRGRHMRIAGFEEDIRKYSEATLLGWTVFRVTGDMVHKGTALNYLIRAMRMKGYQPNHPHTRGNPDD